MQPTPRHNPERDRLDADVAAYLAAGKIINEVPPGVSGDVEVTLQEKSAADRLKKLAFDKARLKEYHSKGQMLHIKFLKKCKTKDARFRFCHHAKVMGYFPTLDEAIGFKVKA